MTIYFIAESSHDPLETTVIYCERILQYCAVSWVVKTVNTEMSDSVLRLPASQQHWMKLQLATGADLVFQIFILYFYLLHYVDSINILVLKLIH